MKANRINTPKVSVIVPVWNPGPGVSRCIESLLSQTLKDIEIIFVDDCGTDDAMERIYKAALKDTRILLNLIYFLASRKTDQFREAKKLLTKRSM